jgi:hypothetical protein
VLLAGRGNLGCPAYRVSRGRPGTVALSVRLESAHRAPRASRGRTDPRVSPERPVNLGNPGRRASPESRESRDRPGQRAQTAGIKNR